MCEFINFETTITIIILDDGDVDDNTLHDDTGDDPAENSRWNHRLTWGQTHLKLKIMMSL